MFLTSSLTLLMMLATMYKKTRIHIDKVAEKLFLPFAALSIALLWYCCHKDGVACDLASLHTRAVKSKPQSGNSRSSPVPSLFLDDSMFPMQ